MNHPRLFAAVAVLAAAVGCHRVLIKIERRSSAGVPDTGGIKPRHFFDGHYIPLPAKPFSNCFDLIASRMPKQVCEQHPTYPLRFAGYSQDMVARPTFDVAPSWLRSTTSQVLARDIATIVNKFNGRRTGSGWTPVEISSVEHSDGTSFAVLRGAPRDVNLEPVNDEGEQAATVRFKVGTNAKTFDGHLYVTGDLSVIISDQHRFVETDTVHLERQLGLPRPVFSFIHLSDAQIREPEATLGGQRVSDTLDPLIESFAHDYEQELFSGYFYEAVIRTINDEVVAAMCDSDPASYDTRAADAPTDDLIDDAARRGGRCVAPDRARTGSLVSPTAAQAKWIAVSRGPLYRIAPSLAIHTGDAIDAGLKSEFDEFLSRSDLLSIPWYSVVGNHDILGFGNLTLQQDPAAYFLGKDKQKHHYVCTPTTRLLREYYLDRPRENGQSGEDQVNTGKPRERAFSLAPMALREVCLAVDVDGDQLLATRMATSVTGTSLFVDAHCRATDLHRDVESGSSPPGTLDQCGRHDSEARGGGAYAVAPTGAPSRLNGYDLEPGRPGYYAFPAKTIRLGGKERALWVVALNTSSEDGAFGEICPIRKPAKAKQCPQFQWLEDVLTKRMKPDDLAFVFGHHPIWGIEDPDDREALKELLSRGNVPAYFGGHTHSPQLRVVQYTGPDRSLDRRFWEVIASSTIAYPQQARQITLKEIPGSTLAYLEVLTFEPHLVGTDQEYVERAQRGAERDACDQHPDECVEGKPRSPGSYLTYPRLFFRIPNSAP